MSGSGSDGGTSGAKGEGLVLRAHHPRIAFAFDFDETLAPSTTGALLRHLGRDPERFDAERVDPLIDDGWEPVLAEARALVELSSELAAEGEAPITRDTLERVGTELELYEGVETLFDRLTTDVHEVDPDLDVEFHLITAGFVHIPAATSISDGFTSIVGGHWAFDDEDGSIVAPKNTVGHYAKVRHLLALAKGLDSVRSDRDHDVDRRVPEDTWHLPFEQIVFVGDGDSDLPAFDLLESRAGTAIAVYQAEAADEWESRSDMRDGRQVACLAPSDFSEGSKLMDALTAAGQRAAVWARLVGIGHRQG